MKYLNQLNIILLLTLMMFTACRKDEIIDDVIIINPTPTEIIEGSISGLVMDTDGQPLADVNIQVGTNNTETDENGFFIFNSISMPETGALVIAQKNGYFYNSKMVRPNLNNLAHTRFKMITQTLTDSFQSNEGGVVSTNGGAKVSIPANGVQLENGGTYSGNVNVYATWLDPTADDLSLIMPGDLRAIDSNQEQVQLATFGMIGVELEGDNVEALNIAAGQTATIELPVPADILSEAPSTIPLWHFNEATGVWEEDGEATLQNDVYIGTVSHFSYWNCDVPFPLIDLTGSVIYKGEGYEDLLVEITNYSSGSSGYSYTDENGFFNGFVPANETLFITIKNACGEIIYSDVIGPFSEDTILDPIDITNSGFNILQITGSLEDCDEMVVSNGYVKITYENAFTLIPVNTDGTFSGTIGICSGTEVIVQGYNNDDFKESVATTYDISGLAVLDVGAVTACEELTQYYLSNVGDGSFLHPNITLNYIEGVQFFLIANSDDPNNGGLWNNIVKVDPAEVVLNEPMVPSQFSGLTDNDSASCSSFTCGNMEITFTAFEYTNPGDYIEATYQGFANDIVTNQPVAVSGSFRLIKD